MESVHWAPDFSVATRSFGLIIPNHNYLKFVQSLSQIFRQSRRISYSIRWDIPTLGNDRTRVGRTKFPDPPLPPPFTRDHQTLLQGLLCLRSTLQVPSVNETKTITSNKQIERYTSRVYGLLLMSTPRPRLLRSRQEGVWRSGSPCQSLLRYLALV